MGIRSLFFVIGLIISIVGFSQPDDAKDSTSVALAIDITQISLETQETELIIQTHLNNNFRMDELSVLDSLIDFRERSLNEEYNKFEKQDITLIGKASLDALISSWGINKIKVEDDLSHIRDLFGQSTSDLDIVKKEIKKWEATISELEENDSPIELTENVNNIIVQLQVAVSRLNKNLSQLVVMETKISQVLSLVNIVETELADAIENRSKDIFVQNAPVIWKLRFAENDTVSLDSAGVEIVSEGADWGNLGFFSQEKRDVTVDFLVSHQNTVYLHIVFWILTIMFSLRIGKKEINLDQTRPLTFSQSSLLVVRSKLLFTATYISILYALLLYEYLPVLISEFLLILLMILNVFILKESKGKAIVKVAIVLSAVFIAGQLDVGSFLDEIGFRVYLFLKIGLTYWVLTLFIKYLQSYSEGNSPAFWKKLNKLAGFTYVLLLISAFSAVIGFVKMSDLTTLLVIQLVVVSFVFYGILVTSNGLVSLIYRATWNPKKNSSLKFRDSLEGMTLSVVNFLAILAWVKSILSTVGIYQPIKDYVIAIFVANLEIGSLSISLQEVFLAIVVVIITFSLTKFIGIIITEGGLDRFKLQRGIPNAISLVVRYTLISMGILLALSVAGINLSSFSLLAGALGIGIGFGLQNIISNFVSGLILVFERPLQEGDVVEVSGLLGVVKNIGVRSSNIRTYTGSEVVVPNEALISKELINWTLSDPNKRLEILIGVDYGSDPRLIIKLLKEAAEANSDVQKDPAPSVYFEEFGDSALNFRLLFWVHHSISLGVRSDVMLRVSDTMRANNINIPFPITTIKVEKEGRKLISPELLKDPRKDVDIDASSQQD